jgi:putative Holliday junction resolvase
MRLLGIDYGSKRIGLAIGDDDVKIATPFVVVGSIEEVKRVIKEEGIEKVVIGLPLSLKRGETEQTKKVKEFAKNLSGETGFEIGQGIVFVDETFTTRMSRGDKYMSAAALILQTYFDQRSVEG